jgi:hypothetical protein
MLVGVQDIAVVMKDEIGNLVDQSLLVLARHQ